MKKTIRVMLVAVILSACMLFACACGNLDPVTESVVGDTIPDVIPDDDVVNDVVSDAYESSSTLRDTTIPTGEYNKGVVLVKYDGALTSSLLGDLDVKSVEQLFKGSKWHTILLEDGVDTEEAVKYLHKLDVFETVDYDYVMKSDGDTVDISGNTYADDLTYLDTMGVKNGWEHNANNKKYPGGSADVVIAIIDTGVDYNHIDLRNNIWVNSAEIPGNGIDDDGNGYVDDVNGWDFVGDDNDPMDDNGHGTHVAGIAAAENNKTGTVGVAYNCKVMCLKAGNSSGYFNNSDIAEAIQYAYMNGASVINMSFGGSSISISVEDALMDAYNQCVLVAAAGNDGLCNQPGCCSGGAPCYPAALPYVIGVMSCNANGTTISAFSNFDHNPYNSLEYEVYACGEQIPSTWPGNKYATLSGTSMACPVVAGIAAVLRSTYPDREVYSNKYIQSQIVNTGTKGIMAHTVTDLYEALTYIPKPNVKLYDYYIFDNVEFSAKNNGNGVVDAGETIHLAIELQNRGGVASNVTVKANMIRNDDQTLTEPYADLIVSSFSMSDIGTYSVRDCGKQYNDEGKVVGVENYIEIKIHDDCPNEYKFNVNLEIEYRNGLDDKDEILYSKKQKVTITVHHGVLLPETVNVDTTFEANKYYILSKDFVVPSGVTVTFEEGCKIQFYEKSDSYYAATMSSPRIINYGTLVFNGTRNNMIDLFPSEDYLGYVCILLNKGIANLNYVNYINPCNDDPISHSRSGNLTSLNNCYIRYQNGGIWLLDGGAIGSTATSYLRYDNATNSYFDFSDAIYRRADVVNSNSCFFRLHTNNDAYMYFTGVTQNCYFSTYALTESYFQNEFSFSGKLINNIFATEDDGRLGYSCSKLNIDCSSSNIYGNSFLGGYGNSLSSVIKNYYNNDGTNILRNNSSVEPDFSLLPLFIEKIEIFDDQNNLVNVIGKSIYKYRVTFNKEMDINEEFKLAFGTKTPFSDYLISGSFINDYSWEGIYNVAAFIENGAQRFSTIGGSSSDGQKLIPITLSFYFDIDTTTAMSMNLLADSTSDGIVLSWVQDDYETLMGYNVYRSDAKDGNYVKLNSSVIPAFENSFVDDNAEPGKTYWYTFTVVFSDMTESKPASKVSCTGRDTILPNVYHTPVNQGYLNNNLVISCTASDNVAVTSVVLYYRTVGATEWKTITMLKQNDKYSATIFGSELTLEGLEYYIVANDTFNSISKGSAETPYTVVVKDASAISRKGDVDGDGVVTTKDALMIMQCINGDLIMSDDEFKRADLNSDGVLSSMEALRILQYINGNVTTLEM